ncbi:MAG: carboxyltransferase domain-containing protein [Thermoanaerobaculum sp.]
MTEHTAAQPSGVILATFPERNGRPGVVYRNAGDSFLLVEFGEMVFDLTMSFRVLGLDDAIKRHQPEGLIEVIPALRSVLINYDSRVLPTKRLIEFVQAQYDELPPFHDLVVPSRIVELPIAFDDKWTREAIARYVQYQRADAPNIINGTNSEYAARYNGLRDKEEFFEYIMATDWWNALPNAFVGPYAELSRWYGRAESKHEVKFNGSYTFPFKTIVGLSLFWQDGVYYIPTGTTPDGYSYPLAKRGSKKFGNLWEGDIHVEQPFTVKGVKFAAYVDLFNMFNNQFRTARYTRQCSVYDPSTGSCTPDSAYFRPTAWQAPRRLQIGFKIEY